MSFVPLLTLSVLVVAVGLVVIRLVRGPTVADRVVALDVLSAVSIGFIATYTVATGAAALLDAALVVALVAFVATVAFARFIERRGRPPREEAGDGTEVVQNGPQPTAP
jgi:multicomponent Na+:H+ antiporter subunit F